MEQLVSEAHFYVTTAIVVEDILNFSVSRCLCFLVLAVVSQCY